jgi:diguanylate cyclase (GGDEF)-like protein/PAS domain S-box-containing protein
MPLRILHLEDNPTDSALMEALLTEHGYSCHITRVESEEDFAHALDHLPFDLIVSDFTLPSYDGRSGLALSRAKAPDVPFIFLSGTLGEDAAVEALKSGATDYVVKNRIARFIPVMSRALRESAERLERQKAETAVKAAEERFQAIYESSKDAIIYAGLEGRLVDVNGATLKLLGYSRDELLTKMQHELSAPEYRGADEDATRQILKSDHATEYETQVIRKDGARVPVSLTRFVVRGGDGTPTGFATLFRDITEQKIREEMILELAYHDSLTSLPNRRLFADRLELSLSQVRRNRRPLAVMLIDLDGFKLVNDTLGHVKGDYLLKQVAVRLKTAVRAGDTVARLGGDEFGILLQDFSHKDDISTIASKILDGFVEPFVIDHQAFPITLSAGIGLFPHDGTDGDTLVKNADSAMYRAKEQGGNTYVLCTTDLKATAAQRLFLERSLRRGLERDEFQIYYQPVIDVPTKQIFGMEALVRWLPPDQRLLMPDAFITTAEQSGLIIPLTMWIMRTACRQTKAWHDQGFGSLRLAVNLSDRSLWRPDFAQELSRVMHDTGLPPGALDLEITERMPNPETFLSQLDALSAIGFHLSMDDFGTGYSCLASLRQLQIKTLKIDQSFVRGIGRNTDDGAIVTALIALAHSLRLKVIAEGVETTDQFEFLRDHGCDAVQGYLFSPAITAGAFTELLLKGRRAAPSAAAPCS